MAANVALSFASILEERQRAAERELLGQRTHQQQGQGQGQNTKSGVADAGGALGAAPTNKSTAASGSGGGGATADADGSMLASEVFLPTQRGVGGVGPRRPPPSAPRIQPIRPSMMHGKRVQSAGAEAGPGRRQQQQQQHRVVRVGITSSSDAEDVALSSWRRKSNTNNSNAPGGGGGIADSGDQVQLYDYDDATDSEEDNVNCLDQNHSPRRRRWSETAGGRDRERERSASRQRGGGGGGGGGSKGTGQRRRKSVTIAVPTATEDMVAAAWPGTLRSTSAGSTGSRARSTSPQVRIARQGRPAWKAAGTGTGSSPGQGRSELWAHQHTGNASPTRRLRDDADDFRGAPLGPNYVVRAQAQAAPVFGVAPGQVVGAGAHAQVRAPLMPLSTLTSALPSSLPDTAVPSAFTPSEVSAPAGAGYGFGAAGGGGVGGFARAPAGGLPGVRIAPTHPSLPSKQYAPPPAMPDRPYVRDPRGWFHRPPGWLDVASVASEPLPPHVGDMRGL